VPVAIFRSAALLLALGCAVSGQDLKVGNPAPALTLESVSPAGIAPTWESLRGKPVVIEFWATWCGYCVEAIPRLNALADQFKEVEFLSISDEPAPVVEPFLAKRPIHGQVALDSGGTTFKAYGVEGRPRTVLVDKNGLVRGAMHPEQLTGAVMADFLAERTVTPVPLRRTLRTLEGNATEPLFAVMIRPATKRGNFAINPSYVEGQGIQLKTILAYAYETYETRLEGTSELLNTRYDFLASLPTGMTGEPQILRDALERSFKLKIRRDAKEVDALVLKAANPKLKDLKSIGPTVDRLAGSLERRLKRYVVNETGLRGYYFIEQPSDDKDLEPYVRSLGLELAPAKRTIETLVVESVELPALH
jgi:thiol-disulfide isomerase/thioredoxin